MFKRESADSLLAWPNGGDNKGRCAGADLYRLSKSHMST
jgi:hypothetical protein